MVKKLVKILTNNFSLKILAVFFAVILWLVVVNIDDPTKTKELTTTVTLENVSYMDTLEKYYEVTNDSTSVTFSISAKRSYLDKISASDFSATANMEKIEYNEKSGTYQIPITITPTRYTSQVTVTSRTKYVTVSLEDLTKKKVMITANTEGTVMSGCALGDVTIDTTNVINISGPESIVNQVNSAVATINVDGMSTNITDNVIPVLYDQDGNVVDTTKLTLSLDVVTVSATILNTKEVSVQFHTTGTPQDSYEITGMEYSPETVVVKGTASALNTIDAIDIPEEVLDVSGAAEDIAKEVDISSYLPTGISLVDKDASKVSVTVHIEQRVTEDFDVPVTNLTLTNVSSSYDAKFEVDTVKVTVSGLKSDVEKLSADDIRGTVDASGLTEGVHMVQVSWDIDESLYEVKTSVTATVNLSAKETDASEETDDENTSDSSNTGSSTENGSESSDSSDSTDTKDNSEDTETNKSDSSTTKTGSKNGKSNS